MSVEATSEQQAAFDAAFDSQRSQRSQRLQTWPALDPIPEPVADAPETFPLDALGPIAGPAAGAIVHDVQVPDALAAGSVLAAASLAAQAHADVVLPHGLPAPLSLFLVTSAESGDRKSAADRVALAEVDALRREEARHYLEQARTISEGKQPSVARSLTIGKFTVEGAESILKNQPHVGLFSPEGGELLGGYSLREERRTAGIAWTLKAWNGEPLDNLTSGKGLTVLLGRRLCLHAMVQPILLRGLLADPLAREQGLLARCLVTQPASLAGTRLFNEAEPANNPALGRFNARIRELLRTAPGFHDGGDGYELTPRPLRLSIEARALWIEFHDELERQQATGGKLARARAWASKGAEHAARLAGVIQFLGGGEGEFISGDSMNGGIGLAEFYLSEHVRLTASNVADLHNTQLHMLADWMIRQGPRIPHEELLRKVTNPIRVLKAQGIRLLLMELTERGYIRADGNAWEVRPDVA